MTALIWVGIILCITQSASFSGLNLAFFAVSKLELEIEARKNNQDAIRVRNMRQNSNFLLATILWGNVAVNVLLALLSGSVLAGILAFLFSTVIITIFGEIIPQAYFSRNALKVASVFTPLIRFYQILLYPVAKPTALILNTWLGPEAVIFFKEKDLRSLIRLHMVSPETEIDRIEGQGAMNFLELDDIKLKDEGEEIDPDSVLILPFKDKKAFFPEIQPDPKDEFLVELCKSEKKWVVVVTQDNHPELVINSDDFVKEVLFNYQKFKPFKHCHRPILINDPETRLGQVISRFRVDAKHHEDDVVDEDIILLWGEKDKRVITGADILGRLLRGIVKQKENCYTYPDQERKGNE